MNNLLTKIDFCNRITYTIIKEGISLEVTVYVIMLTFTSKHKKLIKTETIMNQ